MTSAENEKLECMIKLAYIDDDMSDVAAFKAMDVSGVVLSEKLNRRIYKLINNRNHNKRIMLKKTTVRLLIAAVIAATLIIASILSISAVREAISNLIVKWYQEYITIEYIPDYSNETTHNIESHEEAETSLDTIGTPLQEIQEYKMPQVPSDYKAVEVLKVTNMYVVGFYLNDELSFYYTQKLMEISSTDYTNNDSQIEQCEINGMSGIIIRSNDGYITICLIDNKYVYSLTGQVEENLLIGFANRIE